VVEVIGVKVIDSTFSKTRLLAARSKSVDDETLKYAHGYRQPYPRGEEKRWRMI